MSNFPHSKRSQDIYVILFYTYFTWSEVSTLKNKNKHVVHSHIPTKTSQISDGKCGTQKWDLCQKSTKKTGYITEPKNENVTTEKNKYLYWASEDSGLKKNSNH